MASTTRRRPAVVSTSGNGFHVMAKASGGVDQRQRLPRHGEGQLWRRPTAMAFTSRRRPAAASTSGNGFHVTAKASSSVDQWQPNNDGLGFGPHGPKSGFGSFFIFENLVDIRQPILIMIFDIGLQQPILKRPHFSYHINSIAVTDRCQRYVISRYYRHIV
jgi:hypothetical protein